ncbi:MAG: Trk system potassium transporter TrkA [Oscillospiraceae bacterium]
MKILIAGDGKVGATLARQLSAEGHDLTIIDSNPHVLAASVERYDVMSVQGNCASMDTLRQAGVGSADLLIAAAGADEVNLLCCMTAHGMNPQLHTIARIRNPEYTEQTYTMRSEFALSLVVNPERQAAAEIERLLKYPGFLKRDTFANGRVEIVELRIDEQSKLRDVPLSELDSIIHCKVLVCAVLREGVSITPDGNFILRSGDRIFVTAPARDLSILLKNLGIITRKVKNIMLAGGGKVSYYLSESLQRSGISIKLIEQDRSRCKALAGLLPSINIVNGDASNQELLEQEGLADTDAFITLTGLDELNIILSLFGRKCNVPQVITKLGHVENTLILDSLPIGSIICPRELCCNNILRYVRAMQNQVGAAVTVHKIADGHAEAIEFIADDSTLHCGEALKDIKLRRNVLVVSITRGAKTEIPNGDSRFRKGDTIVVVVSGDIVIKQLNDIFE